MSDDNPAASSGDSIFTILVLLASLAFFIFGIVIPFASRVIEGPPTSTTSQSYPVSTAATQHI